MSSKFKDSDKTIYGTKPEAAMVGAMLLSALVAKLFAWMCYRDTELSARTEKFIVRFWSILYGLAMMALAVGVVYLLFFSGIEPTDIAATTEAICK